MWETNATPRILDDDLLLWSQFGAIHRIAEALRFHAIDIKARPSREPKLARFVVMAPKLLTRIVTDL